MIRYFLAILIVGSIATRLQAQTFPTDWAGYDTHSVTTEPSSNLTDFTYFVSLDQLSTTWWTNVKAAGADIRASKEDNTELGVDVIEFTDNGTTGVGLIAVKFSGTKSSSTDEKIRIWCGCASATLPAVSSTYGGNNAYASHWKAFWPKGGGNDRTSNANNLTMAGSPTVGGVAGPINGSTATDYDGTTQYGTSTVSVPTAVPLSMFASLSPDALTANYSLVNVAQSSGSNSYFQLAMFGANAGDYGNFTSRSSVAGPFQADTPSSTTTGWNRIAGKSSAINSRYAYRNGSVGVQNTSSTTPGSINRIGVAVLARAALDGKTAGLLSFVHIHTTALSDAWFAYDSLVLADPDQSDFFGTWSWTANSSVDPFDGVVFPLQLGRSESMRRFIANTPLALLEAN